MLPLEKTSQRSGLGTLRPVITVCSLVFATCVLSAGLGPKVTHAQSAAPINHAPKGWFLAGSKPANYQTGVDQAMLENGQPSAFLKSAIPATGGFGTLMQTINASDYAGRRVRLRAWVRSEDVADWAGVWMRVDKGTASVAFDNMQNRPIKGGQSWQTCDVVLDVPQDATSISFGILLTGAGEVWMNNLTFEVVGADVAVTNILPSQTAQPNRPSNLTFTE